LDEKSTAFNYQTSRLTKKRRAQNAFRKKMSDVVTFACPDFAALLTIIDEIGGFQACPFSEISV